jgi:uncharacterized protein HemY
MQRKTFTREQVAHLIALAFRSGGSLARDMAENIAFWAEHPVVRRTAEQAYEQRMRRMAEGAARQAERPVRSLADLSGCEWPDVAIPGGADASNGRGHGVGESDV